MYNRLLRSILITDDCNFYIFIYIRDREIPGEFLQIIPVLIKLSVINRLSREGARCKRTQVDEHVFKKSLFSAVTLIIVYLIIWTVVDSPRPHQILSVDSDKDSNVVSAATECGSRSFIWQAIMLGAEFCIILSIVLLTFQSNDVIQGMTEGQSLTYLVRVQSLFFLTRGGKVVISWITFFIS